MIMIYKITNEKRRDPRHGVVNGERKGEKVKRKWQAGRSFLCTR
jgi:hypothetical protein